MIADTQAKLSVLELGQTFFFSQQNGVLGPKRFFPELIASCSFMPTLPNLQDHYVGPQMLVFIHKNIFLQCFDW